MYMYMCFALRTKHTPARLPLPFDEICERTWLCVIVCVCVYVDQYSMLTFACRQSVRKHSEIAKEAEFRMSEVLYTYTRTYMHVCCDCVLLVLTLRAKRKKATFRNTDPVPSHPLNAFRYLLLAITSTIKEQNSVPFPFSFL